MEELSINQSDITFNNDGTITITNQEFKDKIERVNNESEMIRVLKNFDILASNFGYCNSVNAVCKQTLFEKDDISFPANNEVKIKNSEFVTDLVSKKLNGTSGEKLQIVLKGYKSI